MALPSIEELNETYAGKWIVEDRPGEPVRLHKVKEVKDRFVCTFLVETERTWRMMERDGNVDFSSDTHTAESISMDDLSDGKARVLSTEEALDVLRGFRETMEKVL